MTAPNGATTTQYSLTNPPPGSKFEFGRVKTDRGKTDLGEIPILTWGETEEDIQHAIAFYGPQGISDILGGTSLKVSFQGIGRTALEKAAAEPNDATKQAAATAEAIAKAQIEFRPGRREGGVSTPQSRAASQARKTAEVANPDILAKLLAAIQNKSLDPVLLAAAGIEGGEDLYNMPVAVEAGESENGEGQS